MKEEDRLDDKEGHGWRVAELEIDREDVHDSLESTHPSRTSVKYDQFFFVSSQSCV